jgi:hypothetical protein
MAAIGSTGSSSDCGKIRIESQMRNKKVREKLTINTNAADYTVSHHVAEAEDRQTKCQFSDDSALIHGSDTMTSTTSSLDPDPSRNFSFCASTRQRTILLHLSE